MTNKEKEENFEPLEFCWVKLQGYTTWPAYILDIDYNEYRVQFIGDNHHGNIKKKGMFKWNKENTNKFLSICKSYKNIFEGAIKFKELVDKKELSIDDYWNCYYYCSTRGKFTSENVINYVPKRKINFLNDKKTIKKKISKKIKSNIKKSNNNNNNHIIKNSSIIKSNNINSNIKSSKIKKSLSQNKDLKKSNFFKPSSQKKKTIEKYDIFQPPIKIRSTKLKLVNNNNNNNNSNNNSNNNININNSISNNNINSNINDNKLNTKKEKEDNKLLGNKRERTDNINISEQLNKILEAQKIIKKETEELISLVNGRYKWYKDEIENKKIDFNNKNKDIYKKVDFLNFLYLVSKIFQGPFSANNYLKEALNEVKQKFSEKNNNNNH